MLGTASTNTESSKEVATTSTWSSQAGIRGVQGKDSVTKAFDNLRVDLELTVRKQRVDMELTLRKHEAEIRRSMETAKKQQAGEETATDQYGQQTTSKQTTSEMGSHKLSQRCSQTSVNRQNIKNSLSHHLVATRSKTVDFDKKLQRGATSTPSQLQKSQHWSQRLVSSDVPSVPNMWKRARTTVAQLTPAVNKMLPRLVRDDSRLHRFFASKIYKLFWSLVIALDAVLVIAELSYASLEAQSSQYKGGIPDFSVFVIFADLFCLFMFMDMMFQFILECPRLDIIRGRTGYRWLNIIVIIEQLLQVIGQHAQPDARSVSTFRIVVSQASFLRLIRAILVLPEIAVKMDIGVQELRVMIRSLMGAFQPLVWCATPFLFILANFAVFITEGVLVFLLKHDSSKYDDLVGFFGTLDISMLSLYKGILGGMDWGELYDVMMPLDWFLRYVFLFFICFNFIAMLNIVAAVFIKTAFIRSENDRQFLISKEMDAKQTYLETMQDVFAELDEDRDGMIFFTELENHLGKPEVGAYFSRLGVDVNEVEKLFLLLDEDGSGCIDKAEFMFGCLRLKGEARSLDLAILHREVQTIARDILLISASSPSPPVVENVCIPAEPPVAPAQPSTVACDFV